MAKENRASHTILPANFGDSRPVGEKKFLEYEIFDDVIRLSNIN